MRRRIAAAAAFAFFALPSAALADATVKAVDDDGGGNRWDQPAVSVKVGEKVTWSFAGTQIPHNVASDSSNWPAPFKSEIGVAKPDVSQTFTAAGTYKFICEFHKTTMFGQVEVTDESGAPAPPPPPPPLSEQPFPNDFPAPTTLEVLDETVPKLSAVRLSRVTRGARVRFRLSEAGRVTIKLKRANRVIKTLRADARRGANSMLVRGVRAGSYRVEIAARDLSGNPARFPARAGHRPRLIGHQLYSPKMNGERRDEQGADEERVGEQAERDDEADLEQRLERQRHQHAEGRREHEAGAGDHAAGPLERGDGGGLRVRGAIALLADPGEQEDVVVDAERDQEDERELLERCGRCRAGPSRA